MFQGFRRFDEVLDGITIHGVTGGAGQPLLLLHGYPQTHAMWHRVAPRLAQRFTVVAPDLRGYGRSSTPPSQADSAQQSKRAMADDMVALMARLGFDRFQLAGHDRGGRVAHRMAVDHPQAVDRLAVLDIAPTREMYRDATDAFARAYWHWFFLIRPAPLPELMIGGDPEAYLMAKMGLAGSVKPLFAPEALADYRACWTPEVIRASCEDYRAAAGIDIAHDDADAGRKVACPLLCLWGADGVVARCFDPLALWRERASDVRGHAVPGGHYLPEGQPEAVLSAFQEFFVP